MGEKLRIDIYEEIGIEIYAIEMEIYAKVNVATGYETYSYNMNKITREIEKEIVNEIHCKMGIKIEREIELNYFSTKDMVIHDEIFPESLKFNKNYITK